MTVSVFGDGYIRMYVTVSTETDTFIGTRLRDSIRVVGTYIVAGAVSWTRLYWPMILVADIQYIPIVALL